MGRLVGAAGRKPRDCNPGQSGSARHADGCDTPVPKFGNMLLEQFGGANGELAAAMQYSIQGLNRLLPKVG
jgi:hypothetical protein